METGTHLVFEHDTKWVPIIFDILLFYTDVKKKTTTN